MDWTGSHSDGLDSNAITVYPVGQMCALLERELQTRANVKITWGSRVTAIVSGTNSGDSQAIVEAEEDGRTKQYAADYVVGTDGGSSTVRRLLFGRDFPGFSWEEQIVATNVRTSFSSPTMFTAQLLTCSRPSTTSTNSAGRIPTSVS